MNRHDDEGILKEPKMARAIHRIDDKTSAKDISGNMYIVTGANMVWHATRAWRKGKELPDKLLQSHPTTPDTL